MTAIGWRFLVAGCLLVGLCITSCNPTAASILAIRATAPTQDNDSTCASPVLLTGSGTVVMHFRWIGLTSGEDSLVAVRGSLAGVARWVRAGSYRCYAWASNGGGAGCADSLTVMLSAPPARAVIAP